ncbi:MAG: histidine triad (HIT) family protein [Lentisphaeria bacterium]|jgi:histidine triad (HIT) family protein
MAEETIFTKIINGVIPADIIYQDERCVCINDINPQAPTHVLVIPKKPIPRLVDAEEGDLALLGHLMLSVGKITKQLGVQDAFRVVINNGEAAGQTVFHLHLHILANKTFSEESVSMH